MFGKNQPEFLQSVSAYYTDKISQFGPCANGVDWKDEQNQELRFKILASLLPENDFTVLDYGCGYGAFNTYLQKNGREFKFVGYDISTKMIQAARANGSYKNAVWSSDITDLKEPFDFATASGIFNVKLDVADSVWESYVFETLHRLNSLTTKGFSFNMLTGYSDEERKVSRLYYANPGKIFDYCKKNFSKYVSLLHDYPLWEFTILVRKSDYE